MSRIGKLPISIPEKVEVSVEGNIFKVTGPKGTLERKISDKFNVEKADKEIKITLKKPNKEDDALYGTTRAILANMVKGVSDGWSKKLELVGTGYRAEVIGDSISILIGFSQPVKIKAPAGISFKVEKSDITIEGTDKELVGQIAATIRLIRPPEPYKGKGIRYKDEIVRRKAGKAAKTVGAQ